MLDDTNTSLTTTYDKTLGATQGVDPTWDAGVNLKKVSVGDFVWVDQNRDGRQGTGEPGIPGVVLTIVGPDGKPVVDVYGNPVDPVTTGPNGEYTFDNLPALTGDDVYTVIIDQEASKAALAPYVPTKANEGDRELDSSTWQASSEPGGLTDDGDRDPTLDFGFVTKSYAIGDVVWIDANKNDLQDPGEERLAGVKVDLYTEDGTLVESASTDADGRYLFDNLPAGTYQVKFTLTDEQAAKYEFTSRDSGSDAADDANPADGWTITIVLDDTNTALTHEHDREFGATQGVDPTWDAGVVLKPVPPAPDKPDSLPDTGQAAGGLGLAAVMLLLAVGGAELARRRVSWNSPR